MIIQCFLYYCSIHKFLFWPIFFKFEIIRSINAIHCSIYSPPPHRVNIFEKVCMTKKCKIIKKDAHLLFHGNFNKHSGESRIYCIFYIIIFYDLELFCFIVIHMILLWKAQLVYSFVYLHLHRERKKREWKIGRK